MSAAGQLVAMLGAWALVGMPAWALLIFLVQAPLPRGEGRGRGGNEGRPPLSRSPGSTWRSLTLAVGLSGLLALLAWIYVIGMWQLSPPAALLASPRLWTTLPWLGGLRQAFSLLCLFWTLRWVERERGGGLVAWLACAGWLGWAEQGRGFWLAADPQQTQLQLLLTLTLVTGLLRGSPPPGERGEASSRWGWGFGVPLLLAAQAGTLAPRWGLMAALALLLAPNAAQEKEEARLERGEKILAAALALGFAISGGISLGQMSLWAVALSIGLWGLGGPAARWLLALQWGLWLGGESAQYPLFAALGATLAQRLHRLGTTPEDVPGDIPLETGQIFLSWRRIAALGVVLLSWFLLKPGEEWFNRQVLLQAQKAHLPWHRLLCPQPLRWWVGNLGERLEMGPDDLELADSLATMPAALKVLVLTPGARSQSPTVHALLEELAARPLWAWQDGELCPGARHALATSRYAGCGMDCLILRGPHIPPENLKQALKTAGGSGMYLIPQAREPENATTVELHLQGDPAPGAMHPVEVRPVPTGGTVLAQFGLARPPLLVWTASGPNYLPVPQVAGTYPLRLGASTPERLVTIAEPDLAHQLRVQLELPATLPSRSLVEVTARLHNDGEQPVDLAVYRGLRLQADNPDGSGQPEAPVQSLSLQIAAHGQQPCRLYFATPEPEGESLARVQLLSHDRPPVLLSTFTFRTRRRLPPIGF